MKSKTNVTIPLALVTSDNLSPAAKVIYAVLKSFQKGKTVSHNYSSVVVTHAEIMERSNLSKNTIMKAINQLMKTGWIVREINWGSANRYIFTTAK
jgi:predicted transcriptional regulator